MKIFHFTFVKSWSKKLEWGRKLKEEQEMERGTISIFRKVEAHINFDNHKEMFGHSVRVMQVINRSPKTKVGERGCLWIYGWVFKKDRTFNVKLLKIHEVHEGVDFIVINSMTVGLFMLVYLCLEWFLAQVGPQYMYAEWNNCGKIPIN